MAYPDGKAVETMLVNPETPIGQTFTADNQTDRPLHDLRFFAAFSGDEPLPSVSMPAVIPEPSTWIMLATGLLGLGFVAWRRREDEAA